MSHPTCYHPIRATEVPRSLEHFAGVIAEDKGVVMTQRRSVDEAWPGELGPGPWALGFLGGILWLCENSDGKWPFIVDFPIENGDFP